MVRKIRNRNKSFVICLLLTAYCLLPTAVFATHLMGGWAGYQYLGLQPNGNYKYQVTLKVYRYCEDNVYPCGDGNPNCNTTSLPNNIDLGVYTQDWLNPNDPNKTLAASFNIPISSQNWVPLPGASQCATAPVVCVQEGIYSMQIELPPSNGGYHMIWERCCRNVNIDNLANPNNEGQTYYAFIPPTYINNSSPTFAQPPVPYICVNDTASILNTAFDPDGDVVVYSLVWPYKGYSSGGNPAPPPPNPYTFPIPLVTYTVGFSATQPFGSGGFASVNAFTGLSQYLSPILGYYVVATELKEYRNNQLVGITRLDMQIIVVPCPPNNAPNLSPSTSQTSWTANEGDTLCFPITFNDPNGDSVFFNAIGNIFSNPPTNPPATITPNPNSGAGTVTSQFCWYLACGQTGNYMFIVQAPDNGCPPKVTNVVFTIQVQPYTGPSSISGPNPVCPNSTATYSVSPSSGTSFSWTVTGGTITSGQGTNSIAVNWGNGPNGSVTIVGYNSNGCPADPVTLNVTIQSVNVNAGTNSTICIGQSVTLTSNGGGTYSWSPSSSLSNSTIANPVATPTITTFYTVTVTSPLGCTNTGTVSVNVNQQPAVNAGNNTTICNGFSTTIGGSPTGPPGSTYNWSPSSGLNNTTSANPIASPTVTTTYTVVVTAPTACTNTDMVTVTVNQPPVANAGTDKTICAGSPATLNGSGGGTYNWSPSGSLSNPNISNPVASPTVSTTYTLIVSLNNCTDTDFVSVITLALPNIDAGNNVSLCNGNPTTLSASGGITYSWNTGATTTSIVVSPSGTSTYTVVGTGANGCTNTDSVSVFVNALPNINAGNNISICTGNATTLTASGGISYSWSTGATTTSITVSPTSSSSYTVTGTDANGCTNRDSVSVFVNALPNIDAGNNISICTGNSATLTASGGILYSWNTGATTTSITVSPTSASSYTVIGTDANGCTNRDSVSVFVNALPSVNAGPDVSICAGDTTALNASGSGSFSWSPSSGLSCTLCSNPNANPTSTTNYVVTITDGNFCINRDTVQVTVNPLPVPNAGPIPGWVCPGFSITLNSSGGIVYNWSPSGGLSNPNISNPVASPTTTTTYTVNVTDANGCSNWDTLTIFSTPAIPTNAGNNFTICTGQSVTLGGSPTAPSGSTYLWVPSAGLNNSTIANPVASPTSTTTYIVYTSSDTCSGSDSATVVVNALPNIDAGNNPTICTGELTTLTASGGILYSWNTTATTTSIIVSPTSSSSYTVIGTDGNGCSNTDSVSVFVNALPTIDAGNSISICTGNSATFTASGGILYSWNTGATTTSIVVSPTSSSSYTVVGTDGNGCSNTDSVSVFVNPLPSIDAGNNTSICTGNSATLTASGGILYSWNTGATSTSIIVSPTFSSSYTVTGTDGNGCVNIDSVSVFVNALPTIDAGNNATICAGDLITLTASGGISYSWNTTATTTSITVSPTSSSSYTVIGTDGNGCSNVDSVFVFVNLLPNIDAGNNTSICTGDSAVLTASGGLLYSWNTTATTTSITVSPTSSSSYTVIGTDGNGCSNVDSVSVFVNLLPNIDAGNNTSICTGDSTVLTASGGILYSWNTTATTTSITVSPTSSSSYTVIGTDGNGCVNIDSVSVFVNLLPTIDAGNNTSICLGDSSQLTGSGGIIYVWSPTGSLNNPNISNPVATPTSTITYTLVSTDANTCSNMDTVTVTVLALPAVIASAVPAVICRNDTVFLNASGGVSYSWSPASGLSNSAVSNPVATPTSSVTYTVIATGANGCKNYDTVNILVNQLPNIDAGGDIILCPGDSVSLSASGGIIYVWSPVTGLSNPNISNPNAAPSVVTSYTVVGTDANGCSNSDAVTVSIGVKPAADFVYSLSLACEGIAAQFRDSSQNAFSYLWNFGDGDTSTVQNPIHIFPYGGNYVITLTSFNPPCRDTAQQTITVDELAKYISLQTSNVFTPNSDGVNDCFHIFIRSTDVFSLGELPAKFAGCAKLTIYDRWGVPVYHSDYSGACWDGTTSAGVKVSEGTYFYIFDLNGIQAKGFLTVLR